MIRTGNKEVRRFEVPEHRESVDENEYGRPENTPDGEPGLESVEVGKLLAIKALSIETAVYMKHENIDGRAKSRETNRSTDR